MKIYVEELPRSCGDCDFLKETEYCYYCDKLHKKLGYINKEKDCPLQSLSDYTKQVRKEVCEEIGKNVAVEIIDCKVYVRYGDLAKILDQIQGETK